MSSTSRYIPKALLRPRAKPFLIWAAPPFLLLAALGTAAFTTLIALDDQSALISVADQPVSRALYIGLVYPLDLIAVAISLSAAYGLLAERPFARSLLTRGVAVWLVAYVFVTGAVTALGPFVMLLHTWSSWILLGVTFWYFYEYEHVRAYYARIERRRDDASRYQPSSRT